MPGSCYFLWNYFSFLIHSFGRKHLPFSFFISWEPASIVCVCICDSPGGDSFLRWFLLCPCPPTLPHLFILPFSLCIFQSCCHFIYFCSSQHLKWLVFLCVLATSSWGASLGWEASYSALHLFFLQTDSAWYLNEIPFGCSCLSKMNFLYLERRRLGRDHFLECHDSRVLVSVLFIKFRRHSLLLLDTCLFWPPCPPCGAFSFYAPTVLGLLNAPLLWAAPPRCWVWIWDGALLCWSESFRGQDARAQLDHMEALVLTQDLQPSSPSPVWLPFCDSQAHERRGQLSFLILVLNTGFWDLVSVSSLLLNILALGLGGSTVPCLLWMWFVGFGFCFLVLVSFYVEIWGC